MRGSLFGRRITARFRQLSKSAVVSIKVKLLLFICIAFIVSLTAHNRAASLMGWTHPDIHQSSSPFRKGYTVLINTWKRTDLLKQSVFHYASCPGLDAIHIVWSEPDPPSDSLDEFLRHTIQLRSKSGKLIKLRFDLNMEDSLNNRFKEIQDLKTDAIFSIDDDVIFPCESVEFAFSVWQSASDTMVGFVPRMHWLDESRGGMECRYLYGGWLSVWWMGTYSMVLSKAAFFHKKYLDLYTNQMPASIREYTTENRNCEDIAMSFLVANTTGAPPIWVKGKIYEIGSVGISTTGGHSDRRTRCLNDFVALYGRMPLVATTVKAIDSRHSWFW
ncbi:hypothetical protein QJS04_geneDACA011446 [Acorus gramineus]|uniref:Glycosyl transferase 64 domain-containing protein n=1 Tax=Acorus gramineus TaxID=55184 RepID=A0AAV9ALT4_ACOGR|nr:hypothetical protein QJS04_geneDACA011446 [Acorus gramineus]